MKTFLVLALFGMLGYMAYDWYEHRNTPEHSASATVPQTWPLFPSVFAPPQAAFLNTQEPGPLAELGTSAQTVGAAYSYGIFPAGAPQTPTNGYGTGTGSGTGAGACTGGGCGG